ncbi:MAG: amidase domain-containing protein [Oscillospiraceae bacterium]|nr:amidase domain-containing protein [Oscillospiraceae bacterium]
MFTVIPYDRRRALTYAHKWAYGRNPAYYNYDEIGGDCTNYASQCLYAGTGIMNDTPTYGWYYFDANRKSPAWTGVNYFYTFMTRKEISVGPFGVETNQNLVLPGDFAQLRFNEKDADAFGHTPIIVSVGRIPSLRNILVAAHTYDTDFRPLSTYQTEEIRFIHILGARKYTDG